MEIDLVELVLQYFVTLNKIHQGDHEIIEQNAANRKVCNFEPFSVAFCLQCAGCKGCATKSQHASGLAYSTHLVKHDVVALVVLMPYSELRPERQRERERVSDSYQLAAAAAYRMR